MFTVKQAAKEIGVSASKLYELAQRRKIGHYRVERKILFSHEQLQDYLESCRIEAGEKPAPVPRPKKTKFTILDPERLHEAWRQQDAAADRPGAGNAQ
jgi:excisionase family DNA binding protein